MTTATTSYKGFTIQHGIAGSSDRFYVQDSESKIDSMNFSFDGYATLGNAKGAITKAIAKSIEQSLSMQHHAPAGPAVVADVTGKRQAAQLDKVAEHMTAKIAEQSTALTTNGDAPSEVLVGDISQPFDSLALGDEFSSDCLPGHTFTKNGDETASSDQAPDTLLDFGKDEQVFMERRKHPRKPAANVKATASRNKREGRLSGTVDGKPSRFHGKKTGVLFSVTTAYYLPTRKARKAAKIEVRNSTRIGAYGGHIVNWGV